MAANFAVMDLGIFSGKGIKALKSSLLHESVDNLLDMLRMHARLVHDLDAIESLHEQANDGLEHARQRLHQATASFFKMLTASSCRIVSSVRGLCQFRGYLDSLV